MATTTNITTTYAGERKVKYISAALTSGVTLSQESITIMPNVKHKDVLPTFSTNKLVKAAGCDFNPSSTVTTAEVIIEPTELEVNLQICKKNFVNTWDAIEMGYSAHHTMPKTLADYMLTYVADHIAQDVENNVWSGDTTLTSGNNNFDGFQKRITSSALSGVGSSTIDSSNVLTFLGKVVDEIPYTILDKEDLKIWVPNNVYQAYVRSLGGFASNGKGAAGIESKGHLYYDRNMPLGFDGIPVVRAPGMTSNRAITGQTKNLYFGTGLMSDQNEVKLIDTSDTLGDQNVRIIARFTAGTQVGILSEAKHFTPAT